ncbi:MAG: UDP-N-acetylglucosamine 2-epimerase (non-hydrolyzing) [Sphingomonadales bacterium]
MRVMVIAGTRPEIIKTAPVVHALRGRDWANTLGMRDIDCAIIATGQHGALASQAFSDVGLGPDFSLDMGTGAAGLTETASQILSIAKPTGRRAPPADLLLVQGDTNSALAGAMAGWYGRLPVAHVEAGLRSGDERDPFPEEANRRLIARFTALHFAPTRRAAENLRTEGIDPAHIIVTGNTVVDALSHAQDDTAPLPCALAHGHRLVTVTCHRRDNWHDGILAVCKAVTALAANDTMLQIAFVLHGNPALAAAVRQALGDTPRISLLPPQPFAQFIALLRVSALVITDSGGVQEEAVSLGRPVLVCRASSERPEGLDSGLMEIVGIQPQTITARAQARLALSPTPPPAVNPYGDGAAGPRIAEALLRWHAGLTPYLPAQRQFDAAGVAAA